ncbi:MAG: 2Fe-2S iron-sulfur cluster binding domain-containing protein [Pyrinomonadaceae bacterium]|jgi:ferredoxin|nr:2Fe-2S iron-sulfur cluster binding domain-containing protein [Pyrinomonadaceae bacterium]
MKTATETPFESFLNQHDEEGWQAAVTTLLRSIHEVDKTAIQIWFSFYPLGLFTALQQAADPEKLARELLLQGDYYLKNQIDSSHKFIYGHRYWPKVKRAVEQHAEKWNELQSVSNTPQAQAPDTSLADQILEVTQIVALESKQNPSLLVGITAVAFMTVRQTGLEAFKAAPGKVLIDTKHAKKSPDQILSARAKDDSQGLLGFLKTVDKKWTVNHDENDDSANYKLNDAQDLAWGAEADRSRDWRAMDPRRVEGPIPVECRSASCGTCWVGVIGGAEKLSDVAAREGKQIKVFGYIDTTEPKPLIRLACQAQAHGAVSIAIPPWNGVFGKYLGKARQDDSES